MYGVYLCANWLSNLMIHPQQRLDYGFLNPLLPGPPRPVERAWYGTRTEHLLVIPLCLAASEIAWARLWARLGMGPVSLRGAPLLWMANLYAFTWCAVLSFIAMQAALHPGLDGARLSYVSSRLWTLSAAMGLQWHVAHVEEALLRLTAGAGGPVGWACAVLASSTAFFGAKALGFNDIDRSGLSPFERRLNHLDQD